MPLVSALSTSSLASVVKSWPRRAANERRTQTPTRVAELDELLFEPRSELGELLHVLNSIHPIEQG